MATRHLILSTLLAGSALTALAGTQGEGRVDIIAWPGYIERGDTDPAYDWAATTWLQHPVMPRYD